MLPSLHFRSGLKTALLALCLLTVPAALYAPTGAAPATAATN